MTRVNTATTQPEHRIPCSLLPCGRITVTLRQHSRQVVERCSELPERLRLLVNEVFERVNAVAEVLNRFQQVLRNLANVRVGFVGDIHDLGAEVAVLLTQPDEGLIVFVEPFARQFVFVIRYDNNLPFLRNGREYFMSGSERSTGGGRHNRRRRGGSRSNRGGRSDHGGGRDVVVGSLPRSIVSYPCCPRLVKLTIAPACACSIRTSSSSLSGVIEEERDSLMLDIAGSSQ